MVDLVATRWVVAVTAVARVLAMAMVRGAFVCDIQI